MENPNRREWRVIGETVPGASHLRAGIPNQDSILFIRESSRSLPIVLSVSDGHGSDKCFRSHLGSRFAVKKAAQLVSEFLDARRGACSLAEIEKEGKEYLPKEFLRKWKKAVEWDLKNKPFTTEEFDRLKEKDGERAIKLVEDNPLLAYGATSLTVAIEESFLLYLQLGDGEILNISEKGEVTRPLPEDERLFANETTSLCAANPEKDFRFYVQKITDENRPALVLLSTDGYVNSFSNEAGFFQAGTDILKMLGEPNGFDVVNENLKAWLEEATKMGSGDDCTVGIVYRPDAVQKTNEPEKSESQSETTTNILPSVPENSGDVTVTITIKKDKNKSGAAPAVVKTDKAVEESPKAANDDPKENA